LATEEVLCSPSVLEPGLQAVGWVLSSAIVDAVVGSGDNAWSISARTAVTVAGASATWKAC